MVNCSTELTVINNLKVPLVLGSNSEIIHGYYADQQQRADRIESGTSYQCVIKDQTWAPGSEGNLSYNIDHPEMKQDELSMYYHCPLGDNTFRCDMRDRGTPRLYKLVSNHDQGVKFLRVTVTISYADILTTDFPPIVSFNSISPRCVTLTNMSGVPVGPVTTAPVNLSIAEDNSSFKGSNHPIAFPINSNTNQVEIGVSPSSQWALTFGDIPFRLEGSMEDGEVVFKTAEVKWSQGPLFTATLPVVATPRAWVGKINWKLHLSCSGSVTDLNSSTDHVEIYTMKALPESEDKSGPLFFGQPTIPVALLRAYIIPSQTKDDLAETYYANVARTCFNNFNIKYNAAYGGASRFAIGPYAKAFKLELFLHSIKSETFANCYDMAALVQLGLSFLIDTKGLWAYLEPFGYVKPLNLIGYAQTKTNSPFFTADNDRFFPDRNDKRREPFGNHAFIRLPAPVGKDPKEGKIIDACAGPEVGTKTIYDYLDSAIDYTTDCYTLHLSDKHPLTKAGLPKDVVYSTGLEKGFRTEDLEDVDHPSHWSEELEKLIRSSQNPIPSSSAENRYFSNSDLNQLPDFIIASLGEGWEQRDAPFTQFNYKLLLLELSFVNRSLSQHVDITLKVYNNLADPIRGLKTLLSTLSDADLSKFSGGEATTIGEMSLVSKDADEVALWSHGPIVIYVNTWSSHPEKTHGSTSARKLMEAIDGFITQGAVKEEEWMKPKIIGLNGFPEKLGVELEVDCEIEMNEGVLVDVDMKNERVIPTISPTSPNIIRLTPRMVGEETLTLTLADPKTGASIHKQFFMKVVEK